MKDWNETGTRTGLEIAVIGMAGRFPGAGNIDEFWENLKNGVESISFLSDQELEDSGVRSQSHRLPNFVRAYGGLEGVQYFDAFFFGYTPKEAGLMDPQMRHFYECVWTALEDGACDPGTEEGPIGIYAGGTANLFWESHAMITDTRSAQFAVTHLANIDFLSTRIAHKLNLKGPAIAIQTACSTGLAAVDIACRDLLTGQCDTALAGAVSIPCRPVKGYTSEPGMIDSPDGHCRAFDARSAGVIFSDGVAAVVLKRLDDAVARGHTIHAVILATAVNNDGIRKNSFSAPCIFGQAEVIQRAHYIARIEPGDIGYVETHGTGTPLGDPIEIEALKIAFNSDKQKYCGLGSVKSNIGHLDTAAGIAGFIKTVLVVKHGLIPPSLHFETPNPQIDFTGSPFYVNTMPKVWENAGTPRKAGISSFGVGGTNVHAVLEEWPEFSSAPPGKNQLILLSASTPSALEKRTADLVEYFRRHPGVNLGDVAYTLQLGRKALKLRKTLTVSTIEETITLLTGAGDDADDGSAARVKQFAAREENRVVFLFPGQGSQYVTMALDLYRREPAFAEEMNRCLDILKPPMGYDIKEILYPPGDDSRSNKSNTSTISIDRTGIAQPVIFIIEYSLARLLMKWGIQPSAMMGHSIGEYTAACLAGVMTLEDALELVVLRGQLMQQMPPGAMLGVRLPEDRLIPLMPPGLALAAVNSTSLCAVSGPELLIDDFAVQLEKAGHQCRKLHTSHAFHSAMMDPILKTFREKVQSLGPRLHKPEIPYISNLTGNWITVEQAVDPVYWTRHLRETVRFASGLTRLLEQENSLFLEIGPGTALGTFVKQHTQHRPGHKVLNLLRHPLEKEADYDHLLDRIGQLWIYGLAVDWKAIYREQKKQRLHLPTYSFDKQVFPIESQLMKLESPAFSQSLLLNAAQKQDMSQWFYVPSWRWSLLPLKEAQKEIIKTGCWLVFCSEGERLGEQAAMYLKQEGGDVVIVKPGNEFKADGSAGYAIRPGERSDYQALLAALEAAGRHPTRILHFWAITPPPSREPVPPWEDKWFDIAFYSLLYLAQIVSKPHGGDKVRLTVFTNNMQNVGGEEVIYPYKALVLGPVMIIPQEYTYILCRSVDLVLPPAGSGKEKKLIPDLIRENIYAENGVGEDIDEKPRDTEINSQVVLRGNRRLVRGYDPVSLVNPGNSQGLRLRSQGVYLITGGLGGLGLVLAEYLARKVKAQLILTGRSSIPPQPQWETWLNTHSETDSTAKKIRKLQELEHIGIQTLVFNADVASEQQMKTVIARAEEQFGPINGVIHCAGLPGGGIVHLKTREAADATMAPKVKGAWVLHRLFQDHPLDFLVLFSSINSVVSQFGQVDYYSANAFLDTFAWYMNMNRNAETGEPGDSSPGQQPTPPPFTVSINWDTWQQVGMAVESVYQRMGVQPVSHPLWEKCLKAKPGMEIYLGRLNLHHYWVLNEHKTANNLGLLPGTVYLEMIRAAFENQDEKKGNSTIEIQEVYFMNPLLVAAGEEIEIALVRKNQGESDGFTVSSRKISGSKNIPGEEKTRTHTRGKILRKPPVEPLTYNLDEIRALCSDKQVTQEYKEGEVTAAGGMLIFGPRWKNLEQLNLAGNQGLALLKLDEGLTDDIQFYKLHPALLDIATSFLYGHINPGGAYIPFSYKRLTIKKSLPSKLYSYCRQLEENIGRKDLLRFNVTLMDEKGTELVDIEEFTMLEVNQELVSRMGDTLQEKSIGKSEGNIFDSIANLEKEQEQALENGILPEEGIEVFSSILKYDLPQVVVSTVNLGNRLRQSKKAPIIESGVIETEDSFLHSRPELTTPYLPPATETERMVAEAWEDILGFKTIGIQDDFFELGGDSLMAVTITNRMQKALKSEVTLADFFEHRTVKKLAHFIDEKLSQ
jgi:acyl transferase domain-containing protein/acyl carrier protein